jgi:hypothetical protein
MALETLPSAPRDFDFVIGDWRVKHRRLKERLVNCDEWIEFDGEMSTREILGGFGNIEDNLLRFPEGEFRAARTALLRHHQRNMVHLVAGWPVS